jgi:exonuclease III
MQWRHLRQQQVTNPNPRSTMLVDLMEFVNKQLEDEQEILLMWDANMVPLEQDMKTFVDTMGLQDLINYF